MSGFNLPPGCSVRDVNEATETEYVRSPMGEDYHRGELQHVAREWHGGQFSALYAFASSGTVVDGLGSEARRCAEQCTDDIEADKLRALASLDTEEGAEE
jgi:hypothetical protein